MFKEYSEECLGNYMSSDDTNLDMYFVGTEEISGKTVAIVGAIIAALGTLIAFILNSTNSTENKTKKAEKDVDTVKEKINEIETKSNVDKNKKIEIHMNRLTYFLFLDKTTSMKDINPNEIVSVLDNGYQFMEKIDKTFDEVVNKKSTKNLKFLEETSKRFKNIYNQLLALKKEKMSIENFNFSFAKDLVRMLDKNKDQLKKQIKNDKKKYEKMLSMCQKERKDNSKSTGDFVRAVRYLSIILGYTKRLTDLMETSFRDGISSLKQYIKNIENSQKN